MRGHQFASQPRLFLAHFTHDRYSVNRDLTPGSVPQTSCRTFHQNNFIETLRYQSHRTLLARADEATNQTSSRLNLGQCKANRSHSNELTFVLLCRLVAVETHHRPFNPKLCYKMLMKPMCNSSTADFWWTAPDLEQTSGVNPLSALPIDPITAAYPREKQ